MTANNLLMQHQADVLGVPVIRPVVSETTCLGAAYAAGLATGVWSDLDELRRTGSGTSEWTPRMERGRSATASTTTGARPWSAASAGRRTAS